MNLICLLLGHIRTGNIRIIDGFAYDKCCRCNKEFHVALFPLEVEGIRQKSYRQRIKQLGDKK